MRPCEPRGHADCERSPLWHRRPSAKLAYLAASTRQGGAKMKSVAGKVAFVTGGASGMGLAMARSFSAAGMKVVIADIEQAALDKVQAEFRASNSQALTLKVDVTNRDAMEAAAKETERAFGKVHVVCNNAGVAVGGPVDDMTYR